MTVEPGCGAFYVPRAERRSAASSRAPAANTATPTTAPTFTYAMLDSPFPFTDYVATVRLAELAENRTAIEWTSTFEPRGVSAAEATETIQGIYRMFVARLKMTLAS